MTAVVRRQKSYQGLRLHQACPMIDVQQFQPIMSRAGCIWWHSFAGKILPVARDIEL